MALVARFTAGGLRPHAAGAARAVVSPDQLLAGENRFPAAMPVRPSQGPEAAAPDRSGETLFSRYRLLRPVSRGGFAVVYEATDLESGGARVAVKILDATLRDETWMRDRFAYEVAALRSVHHPGVIPILDSWIIRRESPAW